MKRKLLLSLIVTSCFSLNINAQDLTKLFETLSQQKFSKYEKEREKFRTYNLSNYRIKDQSLLKIADMAYDMLVMGLLFDPQEYERVHQSVENFLDRHLTAPYFELKALTDPLVYPSDQHASLE